MKKKILISISFLLCANVLAKSEAPEEMALGCSGSVPVFETNSEESEVLSTLDCLESGATEKFLRITQDGKWIKVYRNNSFGWVYDDLYQDPAPEMGGLSLAYNPKNTPKEVLQRREDALMRSEVGEIDNISDAWVEHEVARLNSMMNEDDQDQKLHNSTKWPEMVNIREVDDLGYRE